MAEFPDYVKMHEEQSEAFIKDTKAAIHYAEQMLASGNYPEHEITYLKAELERMKRALGIA